MEFFNLRKSNSHNNLESPHAVYATQVVPAVQTPALLAREKEMDSPEGTCSAMAIISTKKRLKY